MTDELIRVDVIATGGLFVKGSEPVTKALQAAVKEAVEKAEELAKAKASAHRKTGRYTEALRGKVAKTGRSGRVKAYGGPRKMPYAKVHEAGRYWRTSGARFAGHKVLAQTAREMIEIAPAILDRHIERAAKELD